jgi:hypothetical protein
MHADAIDDPDRHPETVAEVDQRLSAAGRRPSEDQTITVQTPRGAISLAREAVAASFPIQQL